MEQDFRWGGINLRYLFHYLLKNIWMGIVLGIVFFLIGTILSDRSVSTTYSTEALVSVTQSRMAMLPDNLGNRIAYTNAAVTVLGSDAFMTQAREESGIYNVSVTSEVLPGTNIISIECTSDSPNSTYMFMRYLIENFFCCIVVYKHKRYSLIIIKSRQCFTYCPKIRNCYISRMKSRFIFTFITTWSEHDMGVKNICKHAAVDTFLGESVADIEC